MADDLTMPALEVLKCRACGHYIGTEIYVERAIRLHLSSGVDAYALHGECAGCGAQVHWDAPSVTFRRLMYHWRKRPANAEV